MPKQIFNPLSGNFDQVIDQAVEVQYAPTTTTDWYGTLPTNVKEAFDNLANRTELFASLTNPQAIYVDVVGGDNTFGTGGILAPVQDISTALTFVTDPSKYYILHLAPGDYTGSPISIPGNVSITGNEANVSQDVTITFDLGSIALPRYNGVGFGNITMDLTPASVALPVFQNGGFSITRIDATTGAHYIQIYDGNLNALDLTGNASVSNVLFTGSCDVRNNGTLLLNGCVIGIPVVAEELATINMVGCTFSGSITGTTVGLDTTVVRSDATSLASGGTVTGCSFAYLDTADHVGYTPALPGNWSTIPTTVAEGLDTLETDKFDYPTGLTSQYVRGDGTLANFPTTSGGGSSVSYYLNGGTSQGSFGGDTYYEMSRTPDTGTAADFTLTNVNNTMARFITDANDPSLLSIPAGAWTFQMYFSVSNNTGNPSFSVELFKYDGSTFTSIASNVANPEIITNGTTVDLYTTSLSIPTATVLTATDRLAVVVYTNTSGNRTVTLHTQNGHLCQIITTFSTGLNALNGLTNQVQYFATGTTGTDFTINSSGDTHTFDIPDASALARGLLTSTDWSDFDGRVDTASNVGTGESVFKQKTGVDLEFKTLLAGPGVLLSPGVDEVTIELDSTYSATISWDIQQFSGNAVTTTFALSPAPITKDALLVFINGIHQEQSAYNLVGTDIVFTSAPPTGTDNIEVKQIDASAIVVPANSFVVMNETIGVNGVSPTATGILHFKAPKNMVITSCVVQVFEKNGVAVGTLEVDIKKNATPNDTGMTSIFSVKPSFNFASISDYAESTGTLATTSVSSGEYLRLDVTSIPSGFIGYIQVAVMAA